MFKFFGISNLEMYFCFSRVLFLDIRNLEKKPGFKFLKAINMLVNGRIFKEVCDEDVTRSG